MGQLERVALTYIHSLQFSSVVQSYPTLGDLVDCSSPGLPVHPQRGSIYKLPRVK